MNKLFLVLLVGTAQVTWADISFNAPAANSGLSQSTVLSGDCEGSANVKLKGPGIDAGKEISCQKKGSARIWRYELTNAFRKMKDGIIKIEVMQGSDKAERSFTKNMNLPEAPVPTNPTVPTPPPVPVASCTFNGVKLKVGDEIRAFREDRVAYGQPCTSEQRVCTAKELLGTYAHSACTVADNPAPPPVVTGLDPKKAPAANFDLSLWKITLPVDSSGQLGGAAVEVKNIGATYQISPYFYTAADGAMVFMAPTDGARTSGSKYPRSELREMDSSGKEIAWTAAQGGALSATLSVNELPVASTGAKGRIVIGQIHGPDDELCRLYYDNGQLYFYDDKAGSGQTETQFILKSNSGAVSNIPLNAKFDYSIVVANNAMTVTASYNGVEYKAVDNLSGFWPGKALYYKAGAYVQVSKPGSGAGTVGTGRGQVSFYKLSKPTH